MKAVIHDRYGFPTEVLQVAEMDMPQPRAGEVVVRARAAAVSIGDWLVTRGLPYFARPVYGLTRPRQRVPGFDLAGDVHAVGDGVTHLRPGDEVFGWCHGAFAEYVAVHGDALAHKPANCSHAEAAAVPISAFAALQAMRDTGDIQPGQRVLVIGASGGVGTFAVQIARAWGGVVTAVCSTRNIELVRTLGAQDVIDYTTTDVTSTGRRFDLIVDLAGNRPVSRLRRVLAPDGTLVIVGGSGSPMLMGFGRTLAAIGLSLFVRQNLRAVFSSGNRADLLLVKELLESGKMRPVLDRTFPLSAVADAVSYVGERRTRGKTVITIPPDVAA